MQVLIELLKLFLAIQGFRIFVDQKVDFSINKNMILGAVTFIMGVSGTSINIGSVQLKGMAFAAISGIILSITFHLFQKLGLMNEEPFN